MPSYNVYHVVPRDGRWVARLQNSPSISADGDTREVVVEQTERILRQLGSGRIVLHGEDGAIERVHTFDRIVAEPSLTDTLLSRPVLIGVAAVCLVGLGVALYGRRD
ncbi:MAG: DUF2188 domain-containing protein [Bacteroidota bacterium]